MKYKTEILGLKKRIWGLENPPKFQRGEKVYIKHSDKLQKVKITHSEIWENKRWKYYYRRYYFGYGLSEDSRGENAIFTKKDIKKR